MDLQTETDELEVVVVKSWYSYHAKHRDGWEMNIEWEDLDGKTHNCGSLSYPEQLDVGDSYTILVDAATHSRRNLPGEGNITMVIMGVCLCSGSFILVTKVTDRNKTVNTIQKILISEFVQEAEIPPAHIRRYVPRETPRTLQSRMGRVGVPLPLEVVPCCLNFFVSCVTFSLIKERKASCFRYPPFFSLFCVPRQTVQDGSPVFPLLFFACCLVCFLYFPIPFRYSMLPFFSPLFPLFSQQGARWPNGSFSGTGVRE